MLHRLAEQVWNTDGTQHTDRPTAKHRMRSKCKKKKILKARQFWYLVFSTHNTFSFIPVISYMVLYLVPYIRYLIPRLATCTRWCKLCQPAVSGSDRREDTRTGTAAAPINIRDSAHIYHSYRSNLNHRPGCTITVHQKGYQFYWHNMQLVVSR